MLATEQHSQLPFIISGCIAADEVIPAELIHPKRSEDTQMVPGINIDGLTGRVEEADDRLVLHCEWEVARGRKRLLVKPMTHIRW